MVSRVSFGGQTDKFLSNVAFGDDNAVFVFPGLGQFFEDHQRDLAVERLERYKKYLRFYRGDFFHNKQYSKKTKTPLEVNFCGPVVDISVDWLTGKPWKIEAPPGHEEAELLLSKVWEKNNKDKMSYLLSQQGSINGDAYIYIGWHPLNRLATKEEREGKFSPGTIASSIRLTAINPKFVFPLHDPATEELREVIIQYPDYPIVLTEEKVIIRTIHVKADEILTFENDTEIQRVENFLGEIPLVHIRNHIDSSSFFGQSDLENVGSVNQIFNSVIHDLQEILDYHAAPTTLVFGQKVGNSLSKGPNKVWSGFSENARVENLEMKADQKAMLEHLDRLESLILKSSGTPTVAMGGAEPGDTGRAALEILFLPLVLKTRRKQLFYGTGFRQANELILKLAERVFGWNFYKNSSIAEEDRYVTSIQFSDAIPRDETKFIEILNRQIELGLQSRAGALRELGVEDVELKALEILADRREEHLTQIELGRASADAKYIPNLISMSQGSLSLSTGLQEFFDKMNVDVTNALQMSASPIIQEEQEAEIEALQSEVDRLMSEQMTSEEEPEEDSSDDDSDSEKEKNDGEQASG